MFPLGGRVETKAGAGLVRWNRMGGDSVPFSNAATAAALTICFLSCGPSHQVAPGLGRASLLELRCGVPAREVVDRVGLPLYAQPTLAGRPKGSAPGDAITGSYDWIYARPGAFGRGLEATIQIGPDGTVTGIYLEEHDGGIYQCTPPRCPWIIKPDRFEALVPAR